jgi:hypothetical protein
MDLRRRDGYPLVATMAWVGGSDAAEAASAPSGRCGCRRTGVRVARAIDLHTTEPRGLAQLGRGDVPSDVWAVGSSSYNGVESSLPLIERFDGRVWRIVGGSHPNGTNNLAWLNGVAAIAPDDVWAVGSTLLNYTNVVPRIEHFDGTSWSKVSGPPAPGDATLAGVAGTSSTDVWAVGTSAGATWVEHWDGARWRAVSSPNPNPGVSNVLFAVAALSPTDAYAVGAGIDGYDAADGRAAAAPDISTPQATIVLHWDGSRWRNVADASVPNSEALGVASDGSNGVCADTARAGQQGR